MRNYFATVLAVSALLFAGCGDDEGSVSTNDTTTAVEPGVKGKEFCVVNNRGKEVFTYNRLDDSHVIQMISNTDVDHPFAELDIYIINTETCKVKNLGKSMAKGYAVFGFGRCVYNARTATGEPVGELISVTTNKIVETGVHGTPLAISPEGVFYEDSSSHINLLKNNGTVVSLGRDRLRGKDFVIAGLEGSKIYFTTNSYSGVFSQSTEGGSITKIAENSLSRSPNGALNGTNLVHSPFGPVLITKQHGGLAVLDAGKVKWITSIPGLKSPGDYKRIARDTESLYIAMRGEDDKSEYSIYRWSGGQLDEPVVLYNTKNEYFKIHAVVPDGVLVSGDSRELWLFKHDGSYELVLTREEYGGGIIVSADKDRIVLAKNLREGTVLQIYQR